jgi:signal peptidase II
VLGRKWTACTAVVGLAVAVDQAAKWLVVRFLPPGDPLTLVDGFLALAQVRQEGAALGLLTSLGPELLRQVLPGLAGLAAVLLGVLLWRAPRGDVLSGTGVGLIAGGAIANLLDRLRLDVVIEFVQLDLRFFRLPDFNLADCLIAAGMALLLLDLVASEAGVRQAPD